MKKTKFISAAAAAAVLIMSVQPASYAEEKEYVYVTIENNHLSVENGAPWEGEKISRFAVEITEDMTAAEATAAALEANGYTSTGLDNGWVTELAGLSSSASDYGAWMMSVNDYFGSMTCNQYIPENGDEIVWEFSTSYGSDLGTNYMTADTTLKMLEIDGGTIATAFDGSKTSYYLTLDPDLGYVTIDPLMNNRYFQSRIYKNIENSDYDNTPSYHHGEKITVIPGDTITIACGVKGWDNGFYYNEEQTVEECIYTLEAVNSQTYTITAPQSSNAQIFSSIKNYNTEEIMPSAVSDNGDGTKSVSFRLPETMNNYTYRVSEKNKITKAGYIKDGDSGTAITFGENENPEIRPEYDTETAIGRYAEDNLLLNINEQNYLRLKTGEEYKVRGFRAWQIVNNVSSNIIIEPDFHYNIISGDSIEITPNGSGAVVKAIKSGISVVEVTYDAIEIGGNTQFKGIYGAVAPSRKGMFIVNVDGDSSEKITMPDWDTEFDTVYFTGDFAEYEFAPSAEKELSVCCNGENAKKNDNGKYILKIKEGNNIVSVSCGETTEYTIIKGGRVSIVDTENGFKLKGVYLPIPKMAGVYNPNSVKTMYGDITSNNSVYDFGNKNEMTVSETGILENGTIKEKIWGSEKGMHRKITDEGLPANTNAPEREYTFSVLPEVRVSSQNDIFTASYDENGVLVSINKYHHVIEDDGADKVFLWNKMQPVFF